MTITNDWHSHYIPHFGPRKLNMTTKAGDKAGDPPDRDDPFKHTPLDHTKPSLRFVQVCRKLSTNGLIQCRIEHSTMTDLYTCLSYVWGQLNDQGGPFPILIDGKRFEVRYNLHAFLGIARKKYPYRKLWIDAVCIDQISTAERNHQVQQMGKIYGCAKKVIVWLGEGEQEKRGLRYLGENAMLKSHALRRLALHIGTLRFRDKIKALSMDKKKRNDGEDFAVFVAALSRYWNRGWTTQEVALAERLVLLVRDLEIPMANVSFMKFHHMIAPLDRTLLFLGQSDTHPYFFKHRYTLAKKHGRHKDYDRLDGTLLNLLHRFEYKQCTMPQDRIFSLLALARDGSYINVDYNLSKLELLRCVFRAYGDRACPCTAPTVPFSLGLFGSDNDANDQNQHQNVWLDVELQLSPCHPIRQTNTKMRSEGISDQELVVDSYLVGCRKQIVVLLKKEKLWDERCPGVLLDFAISCDPTMRCFIWYQDYKHQDMDEAKDTVSPQGLYMINDTSSAKSLGIVDFSALGVLRSGWRITQKPEEWSTPGRYTVSFAMPFWEVIRLRQVNRRGQSYDNSPVWSFCEGYKRARVRFERE
jgi:hypothetical protein